MSVGQLVHPSVSLSVGPSVGPLVHATHVTFPNFLLIKISLGQIKSREVNSSHFGHGHGIDEEMDKKRLLIDPRILALHLLLLIIYQHCGILRFLLLLCLS